MPRVLVTGGAGTIGAAVVRRLLADPRFEVRVSDQRDAPDWMREGCEIHQGDLRDRDEAARAAKGCSHVIHLAAIVGGIVAALWLAVLLNRKLRFQSFFRAVILLPYIVPTALSAIAFWWIFDSQYSIISWALIKMGLISAPINFLGDVSNARASVIAANVWRGIPFVACPTTTLALCDAALGGKNGRAFV